MPNSEAEFTFQMHADLDAMADLAAWADTVITSINIGPARSYALHLCLEELVANVILHAVPLSPCPVDIAVAMRPDGSDMQLVIEDTGPPFDPTQAGQDSKPETVQAASAGGRGLMLVSAFAQALTYSRTNNRNCVVLDFSR